MDLTERPLITLVVFAYNQKFSVREAVESACNQTYTPLEIILSDDASGDGTFEVMSGIAALYRGPHQIRLNRQKSNTGIVNHYNSLCGLATGKLIVFAAGDDVSAPHRVQRIFDEWTRCGSPREAVFYSRVQRIKQDGSPYPREGAWFGHAQTSDPARLLSEWGGFVIGATMAITDSLYERFGPILSDMPCEDIPTLWRGALLGNLIFIDEALVRWRIGGAGLWSSVYSDVAPPPERIARMRRYLRERMTLVAQARRDVAAVGSSRPVSDALKRFELETAWALARIEGSSWRLLLGFAGLWAKNGGGSHALRECVVEHIRISRALGRNRALAAFVESVAVIRKGWKKARGGRQDVASM